ncbi:hypothetical protein [Bounagaea algeriensis]
MRRHAMHPEAVMNDEGVFERRWQLTEDELLRLLWECHAGENPDVALLRLHASRPAEQDWGRTRARSGAGATRVTRHVRRTRRVSR